MIEFLLKSTLSLGLCLVIYFLFLEKEKMHHFNRFYLLFGILFSFAIPFISIETYETTIQHTLVGRTIQSIQLPELTIGETKDYTSILLWSMYGVITTILLFRFIRNLVLINRKINTSPTETFHDATLVLLPENVLPYTFLNHIFLNKEDYTNKAIQEELYTHELTHVQQKHTYDVLFIEALKILFWFNPLLYSYKKAIQLNHEFLADEKVVYSYNDIPSYQSLLLEKTTWKPEFSVASNLNFLITKKRFTMMTKTTPARKALLKKLILVPLCLGLVLFFCTEIIAQDKSKKKVNKKVSTTEKSVFSFSPPSPPSPPPPPPPPVLGTTNLNRLTTAPEYKGGLEEFYKFIAENYKTPKEVSKSSMEKSKIKVAFIVEKDGSISDIKCITTVPKVVEEETIRVLSSAPKNWIPGTIKNNPVRVQYMLPITFASK